MENRYLFALIACLILFIAIFISLDDRPERPKSGSAGCLRLTEIVSLESSRSIRVLLALPIVGGFWAIAIYFPGFIYFLTQQLVSLFNESGEHGQIPSLDTVVKKFAAYYVNPEKKTLKDALSMSASSQFPIGFESIVFVVFALTFFSSPFKKIVSYYRDVALDSAGLYDRANKILCSVRLAGAMGAAEDELRSLSTFLSKKYGYCYVPEILCDSGNNAAIVQYCLAKFSAGTTSEKGLIHGVKDTIVGSEFKLSEDVEKNLDVNFMTLWELTICMIIACIMCAFYAGMIPYFYHYFYGKISWPEPGDTYVVSQCIFAVSTIILPTIIGFFVYYYGVRIHDESDAKDDAKGSDNNNKSRTIKLNAGILSFIISVFVGYMWKFADALKSQNDGAVIHLLEPRQHIDCILTAVTPIIFLTTWFFLGNLIMSRFKGNSIALLIAALTCGIWGGLVRYIYELSIRWPILCGDPPWKQKPYGRCDIYYGKGYYVHNFVLYFYIMLITSVLLKMLFSFLLRGADKKKTDRDSWVYSI